MTGRGRSAMLRAGWTRSARKVQAERNRNRLPPRRKASRWARRIAGLLATAAFIGVGVAIALMVLPDTATTTSAIARRPDGDAGQAEGQEEGRPRRRRPSRRGRPRPQREARKAAVADVRKQGFTTLKLQRLRPEGDAAGAVGRPVGDAAGGNRRLLLHQGRVPRQRRARPEREAEVAKTGKTTVTLSYGVYAPGDTPARRAAASACGSGSRARRSSRRWTRSRSTAPVSSAARADAISLPQGETEEDRMEPSYASGTSYDAAAGRDDRRQPRPHGRALPATARRSSPSTRTCATPTRELGEAVDRARAGVHRRRASSPATASGSGARTAPSGRSSSTRPPRPGSSSSTSTRPTGRPSSSTCCASPAAGCWSPRPRSRRSDYVAMVDEVRGDCPALERVVFLGRDWDEFIAGGERRRAPASCRRARPRRSSTTRSTSSTRAAPPASPRARRSATTTSSTTASSSGEGCRYTEEDRVCIPVPFYHCFGMVMGNLGVHDARRLHGHPGAGVRARWRRCRPCRTSAARALYGVPTMFIAELEHPRLRRVRPLVAAHRDHGRLAVPGRDHAPRHRPRCTWRR